MKHKKILKINGKLNNSTQNQLAITNNRGTSIGAALQQSGSEGSSVAAVPGSLVGFVWEPVWEGSAALPCWDWGGGGSSVSGGDSDWGGGGEWSGGGWHEAVGNDTSAGEVSVETESDGESVVQVVKSHMVEDVSEEVSINFAVVPGATAFGGISVVSVWVSGGAKSGVIVGWVEWKAQAGQDIGVLDGDIAGFVSIFVVDSDAVFAVVPPLAHTVDVVHRRTSSWFVVTKVAPATVLEDVGQSEQVHDVSVISGGSEGGAGDFAGGRFAHGRVPEVGEFVAHSDGAHRAD